ncbi:NADPH-dependent FMN reductase [Enterobacterales bacterium AW_CKDN230030176-1A_HGKHYDSX7]
MSQVYSVAVIVGSLRKASYNRKVAKALMSLAPSSLELKLVEIGDLPLYNEDLEDSAPEAWSVFRQAIKASDAVVFVTPEYNRTMTGALKNAIDVGSRPYGDSAWNRKPSAVVSASPGGLGGFGANHNVRQALVFLDMPCMQMPEAYIGGVADLFDEQDNLSEKTRPFLQGFMNTFADWVARNHARG